jgi:hypothetical protein
MCWIAKYLCWSSVGEAFSLTYLLLLISAARSEREREKKKKDYLVLTMETGMGPLEPLG